MNFVIDINNSDKTVAKFIKDNNLEACDCFTEYFKTATFTTNQNTKEQSHVALEDLKIGDAIIVTYTPLSQKYIDIYNKKAFRGTVLYIDKDNDNLLAWYKHGGKIYVKSLEQDGCSYFGTSRSYIYSINYASN